MEECACAEAKVSYRSGPQTRQHQVYSVSMFVFVPEQLSAVSDDLYNHLTQDVRLHTPKVTRVSSRICVARPRADHISDVVFCRKHSMLQCHSMWHTATCTFIFATILPPST